MSFHKKILVFILEVGDCLMIVVECKHLEGH